MKSVMKARPILHALQHAKCKLHRAIINNCDDVVIKALSEIIHNLMQGNIDIDSNTLAKLQRYKRTLRMLHQNIKKNTSSKYRRKQFANQKGGFWPLILGTLLQGALAYGGEKLAQYGTNKLQQSE